jgi:hypothetical protein
MNVVKLLAKVEKQDGFSVVVSWEDEEDAEVEEVDPEACPGCCCRPGDGISEKCEHPEGCGFNRVRAADAR